MITRQIPTKLVMPTWISSVKSNPCGIRGTERHKLLGDEDVLIRLRIDTRLDASWLKAQVSWASFHLKLKSRNTLTFINRRVTMKFIFNNPYQPGNQLTNSSWCEYRNPSLFVFILFCSTDVTFWHAPIFSRHKGYTQMEYLFICTCGLCSTSFIMYYTSRGGMQEWGKCLYLLIWGSASENITPVLNFLAKRQIFLVPGKKFNSFEALNQPMKLCK